MQTINLTCDRCKKTETLALVNESKLKLMKVGIAVRTYDHYSYGSNVPLAELKNSAEWCESCRAEVGLVYQNEEQLKAQPNPSLEEQLLEVLRCFIQENSPQQNQ